MPAHHGFVLYLTDLDGVSALDVVVASLLSCRPDPFLALFRFASCSVLLCHAHFN